MAWNFRPGIRTEIVFTLTVLMAGTIALVGILFLKVEERTLLQQKIRGGKQLIFSLQWFLKDLQPADLEISDSQKPPENLQRISTFFAQSQLFSNFSVVDRKFRVLVDSNPGRVGTFLRDYGLEKALNSRKILAYSAG